MSKINKFLPVFALTVFASVIFSVVTTSYATESHALTEEDLLVMSKSELLETLQAEGLILPEDYATHVDMAENFVYKYTPMIIEGTINANENPFNYNHSNEMLHNLGSVLNELDFAANYTLFAQEEYTLQDNTPIGSWNDSYDNYNCYAYALERTSGLQPGYLSGDHFSMTMSISAMADVVLSDLDSQGYWGYTTTTKPTSLPDSHFHVIAMRKDNDNVDYHFMRPYSLTLNSWSHKPGRTQPLKWNYSSPNSAIWTNECVYKGMTYAPDVTYESEIYYIVYKHRGAPGIQPNRVETTTLDSVVECLPTN